MEGMEKMAQFISAQEALAQIKDGQTVAVGGFGAYCGPDALLKALRDRFDATGSPTGLTVVAGSARAATPRTTEVSTASPIPD